jgi:hypothetical protein
MAREGQQYALQQVVAAGLKTQLRTEWVGGFLNGFTPQEGSHPDVVKALPSLWQATVDAGTSTNKTSPQWYRTVFTRKAAEWHPDAPPAKGKAFANPASSIAQTWQNQPTGDVTW